jgi:hypothetical protein
MKYRFRLYRDVEVDADNPEQAEAKLHQVVDERRDKVLTRLIKDGEVALLGPADVQDLTDEHRKWAGPITKKFENMLLMSGMYRGEPCAFIAMQTDRPDLGDDYISIRPVAIVLTEDMLAHCRDPQGGSPQDHGYDY